MNEESCRMLTQLYQIVQFHLKSYLTIITFNIIHNFKRISIPPKIPRQERRLLQDRITPYRNSKIVYYRKSPFHKGITFLYLVLQFRIFSKIDIMLNEKSIEVIMYKPLYYLNEKFITPYIIPAGTE